MLKLTGHEISLHLCLDLPSDRTGLTYHGKAADTWAVGVTLYCMILGQYPFLGETLQDTYDKASKRT
jgi:serine/threonine protein kinase